mmetsp:Transcript_17268/g.17211  ORF Transcript_17268/g.17211 Transcript_17268/m.17211 type:complete len:261 (-) Transcript_17268:41-823(-)
MLRRIINRPFSSLSKLQSLISVKTWEELKDFTNENTQLIRDFASGTPFTASSGITFSKIARHEQDEAFEVLGNIIPVREPMAAKLQMTKDEFIHNTCLNFMVNSKYEDLTIVAKDKNKIIGVFTCIDWANQKKKHPKTEEEIAFWTNKLEPIALFLHNTNRVGPKSGRIAHGITSGVQENYLNQGIAKSALALRLAMTRVLGYDFFIVECGFGSSNAFMVYNKLLQFGSEMRYEDFEHNDQNPFEKLEGGYLFMYRELQK